MENQIAIDINSEKEIKNFLKGLIKATKKGNLLNEFTGEDKQINIIFGKKEGEIFTPHKPEGRPLAEPHCEDNLIE